MALRRDIVLTLTWGSEFTHIVALRRDIVLTLT